MEHGELVYLGMGGNFKGSGEAIKKAIEKLENHPQIWDLRQSPTYQSTAVSIIPQADYLNLVCQIKTSLTAHKLHHYTELIERELGQSRKAKDAPRLIDIDLLIYGNKRINDAVLEIPHPRWRERNFVLQPLSDLTNHVEVPRQDDPSRLETLCISELLEALHLNYI